MIKQTTLPSGVRVVTRQWATGGETATAGVWVGAGSACDAADAHGAAHFLEHMVLKGSRAWPSRRALETHVEGIGAQLHAFTSREQTCFFARARRRDAAQCVSLLADLALHPRLRRADVDAERATVVREMEEVARQPEEVVYDALHALAFPQTRLGRTILGSSESVAHITREDLASHLHRWYTPERIVVAAAGPVSHTELVGVAEKSFPNHCNDGNDEQLSFPPLSAPTAASFRGGGCSLEELPAALDTNPSAASRRDAADPLVYCGIASRAPAGPPFPWLVLQALTGSSQRQPNRAASLARACRSQAHWPPLAKTLGGLCERVQPFYMPYAGDGLFGLYFAARRSQVPLVLAEIHKEWRRVSSPALLSESEVQNASRRACEQQLMGFDTTVSVCEDIGHHALFSPSAEMWHAGAYWTAGFAGVSAKSVQNIAKNHLLGTKPIFAAIGSGVNMSWKEPQAALTSWV